MTAEKLIQHYNRLNGNAITVARLKDFHAQVQKFLDSTGSGPYVNDLKGIYGRLASTIKQMVSKDYYGVERIELVPIDVTKKEVGSRQSEKPKAEKFKVESVDKTLLHGLECIQNDTDLEGKELGAIGDTTYKVITDKILSLIEKDGLIWRKPWNQNHAGKESHAHNYITKTYYRGANFYLNYLLLSDFKSPYFFTYKQVSEKGGTVKAGQKGWPVIYFKWLYKKSGNGLVEEKEAMAGNKLKPGYERFPALFYYTVFNYEQCEGLTVKAFKEVKISLKEKIESCERIVASMPKKPAIEHKRGDDAYYRPSTDSITMPLMEQFKVDQQYYSVLFHEMIHSTGAKHRVGRDMGGRFGSKSYAFEELIAELGASFLCGESGVLYHTMDNSAAYIKSWSKKLKEEMSADPKFFLKAAAAAEKASEFILSGKPVAVVKEKKEKISESQTDFNEIKSKVKDPDQFQQDFDEAKSIGLNHYQYLQVVAYTGSWSQGKKTSVEKLVKIPGIGKSIAQKIKSGKKSVIKSRKAVKRKEASVPGVKASVAKAISDLVEAKPDKYGKKAMAMQMLYSKFKETDEVELEEDTLIHKLLEKENWIEYERDTNASLSTRWKYYSITPKGKEVIESIEGRLNSLRVKKQGGELFPNLNGPKKKAKATRSQHPEAKNLSGIVDASALAGMHFRTFELTDRYKREFHKLNSDTQAMIWGSPGHGKTVWALQFAQYLAEKLNLKTLYIADEEFGRSTFSEKIRDFKIGNPNLHFAKRLDESVIDQYDAVFFDSINSIGMSIKDYQKFVDRHPGKLYVLIVQSTKDGDFRGGNDWEHEVDVAGEIRNRQLILHKNRFDKHNPEKMEKLMTENAIAEAKKKEVIKRAVKSQINTVPNQQPVTSNPITA